MTGVGIVVFAGLVALIYPVFLKQKKAADCTSALNNMMQISACLLEFDTEYGSFPDDQTALDVKDATKTDFVLSGQYSNDYFRQMMVGKGHKSELPFWCKTPLSPTKPDEDFSTAATALAAGEVGFSYILASQTQSQSPSGEPSRPVVMAPSYQFRADWTFDPDVYQGRAVVLRLDNSVGMMQIREADKKVTTYSGKTLGDTGDNTPWGTSITPVLRAPQPK